MNIYKQEFKMNLKSALSWSFWLALLFYLFMLGYSLLADEMASFSKLMENYPKELMVAFGMDGLDMSTILGFLGMSLVFSQLCLSIQAANYGISLVSVEERELTADFLLAKPVSRQKILTEKFKGALTNLLITNIVFWSSAFIFIEMFKGDRAYDQNTLILLLLSSTLLQLFFFTFGLLISLLMKKVRSVTSVSMGLVFGMYILSTLGTTLENDIFGYLTPFHHFDPNSIITTGKFDTPLVILNFTVIIISVIGSYYIYQNKDIHSV